MRRNRRKDKAFTLVELLVVIVLLALIASVYVPKMFKGMGAQKAKMAKTKMANIESAILQFQLDCGRFPDDSLGLDELRTSPADLEEKWKGPYLKQSQLLDPWEYPYIYVEEGQINPGSFDLISYGADGEEGGEGDNADIYNE
ncbi:MAG: type II secretion system major pseudopilin GspG [Phycisphaerae bacterium]|nr:type II secretion system major pseudopilin GspG [Phycisphaerae bacterium]